MIDTTDAVSHPRGVLRFSRRLAAALLTLALAGGQSGICAGWMPTPEARMACCADDAACPMHASASQDEGSKRALTQAEADRCCAASEQGESSPSPFNATFFVTLAVALDPVSAPLSEPDAHQDIWRSSVPVPPGHVAKHLLLSVFLV